ncbi:cellulose binding domain-containing protein [Nonomuraea africana]|uniref:CBM2 domain-containing protein n=1 Tax=Nonomuraea africana TaxID=46171 RepID=A0ABR9KID9_9ACTN|nr:cellulose binding domain-containing protein [Nonomuraea africana]MBE1561770.1 hypothetical protein [Nonomuraea africana]
MTVRNVSWNGALAEGGMATFGFTGSWTRANGVPSPVGCAAVT